MVAAIAAARCGAKVTILEQKERLGKKILATGNGRCNLTNEYMDISCFRGEDVSFAEKVLKRFGYPETLKFFADLGVITKSRSGYIYPRSDQATTIVEALEMELKRLGVFCALNTRVEEIKKTKKGFAIHTIEKVAKEQNIERKGSQKSKKKKSIEFVEKEKMYYADKVILSAGSKASSVLGSDGSGYTFAKYFGHTLAPVVPALVQLRSEDESFKKLAGIRTEGTVHLYVDHNLVATDTGEIQLTDYGISGIPVFQVSRFAALGLYQKKSVKAVLDFISFFEEKELEKMLLKKSLKWQDNTVEEFLSGVFNKKLIPVFLEKMSVERDKKIKDISPDWYRSFSHFCKNYEVVISGTNSFDQAQVCAGGVRTAEVDDQTMQSIYEKDLYITGELLDVEGICGGYNLQWAWSTGMIAGTSACS